MLSRVYSTNMAAPSLTAVRTLFKSTHLRSSRWLLTQTRQTAAMCRCQRLHVSPAASLCSSRTDTRRNTKPHITADREGEEEPEGPEYIPKKKAKNPMMKIGYAWMIGLPTGIISFLLAKREVDKNRLKQLKVRQRMKQSNEGEYEGSRYRQPAENVKLD